MYVRGYVTTVIDRGVPPLITSRRAVLAKLGSGAALTSSLETALWAKRLTISMMNAARLEFPMARLGLIGRIHPSPGAARPVGDAPQQKS